MAALGFMIWNAMIENGGAKLDHGSAAILAVRAAQKSSILPFLCLQGGRGIKSWNPPRRLHL